MQLREGTEWNYSYYPVIFDTEAVLLQVQKALNDEQIFPRRYFYPSLNKINYVNGIEMTISESIASRVMCLPLFYDLKEEEADLICRLINKTL